MSSEFNELLGSDLKWATRSWPFEAIDVPESDECIGCETGCDCDDAHRDESGNYHPMCCSRAAEKAEVAHVVKTLGQFDIFAETDKDDEDAQEQAPTTTRMMDEKLSSRKILDYLHTHDLNTTEAGDFAQQCLDRYAECKCCDAHQVLKPTIWSPLSETPKTNLPEKECNCDCRHTARHICRRHPTLIADYDAAASLIAFD
jgi:hypothetical protein